MNVCSMKYEGGVKLTDYKKGEAIPEEDIFSL